jgi:hypothetical protein
MESVFTHVIHAAILTGLLYLLMYFLLRQSPTTALRRSVLLGAVALIYMLLFGHGLPTRPPRF